MSTTAAPAPTRAILRAEPELVPARGGRRAVVLHRLLALADIAGTLAAVLLASLVAGMHPQDALAMSAACAFVMPMIAFCSGLYAADDLRAWATGVPDLKRLMFATLALSWPLFALASAVGTQSPASVTLSGTILTFALVTSGRALARAAAHRSEVLLERTVIVGSGLVAGELVETLKVHREFGLLPVGVVEDAKHHRSVHELPLLGSLDELSQVLRRDAVDRVIIAFSRASHVELLKAIRACRDGRVPVHVVPRLFEFLDGARSLDHVGGMPLLSLGVPRLSRIARATKRALDIAAAGTGLVLCAPLFAAIAIAIKLESPGPVFFRQIRGGRAGKSFELVKFRSMFEGADARKAELLDDNEVPGGVMFKIRQDPRITGVGRVLRRFSLDELPQLWNVLRGDMSLVGPRPPVDEEELAKFGNGADLYVEVRPGITGLWQVSGRSDTTYERRVQLDSYYVQNWSPWLDLHVLARTVSVVLNGSGAR